MEETINLEKQELMDALAEAETELQKLRDNQKKELVEKLSKLTGKKADELMKYDEMALKEMISIAEKKEEKSKGVVESSTKLEKEESTDEDNSFIDIDEKDGSIGLSDEGWKKFQESMNLDWIDKVKWIPQRIHTNKKGAK